MHNIRPDLINQKILGIDYGKKFTGLATYKVGNDPFALLWGRLRYVSDEQLVKEIVEIIEDEFIDLAVLGIPFFVDGKRSDMTKTVQQFAEKLKSTLNIPLYFVDESLTSFEAKERMKNDPKYQFKVDLSQIDALSASIIIEEFLKNPQDDDYFCGHNKD